MQRTKNMSKSHVVMKMNVTKDFMYVKKPAMLVTYTNFTKVDRNDGWKQGI